MVILLVPGLILLAPFFLSLTARLGRRAPIAIRLALRDLVRFRARSGSALAAISIGVLVAVIVVLAAAARYRNVFDYAGPNLAPNELALHANLRQHGQTVLRRTPTGFARVGHPVQIASHAQLAASAKRIARGLDAQAVPLVAPTASLVGTHLGRPWSGAIYVGTPSVLRAFGIRPAEVDPHAVILTSRPGLSGVSGLALDYATSAKAGGVGAPRSRGQTCTAATQCLAHPVVQEVGALPKGTSAPNTVLTEHAVHELHVKTSTNDWLVLGSQPFGAAQINGAQVAASKAQLSVEAKDDAPTSTAVTGWATIFGVVVALGVLGMAGRGGLGPRRADRRAPPQALHPVAPRRGARPRDLPGSARLAPKEAASAVDDPVGGRSGGRRRGRAPRVRRPPRRTSMAQGFCQTDT